MTRGQFLRIGSAGAAALAIRPFAWAAPDASKFYFALIADTHIIDSFYKGPEGNAEDTESIFKTSERLIAARTLINSLQPKMERVFLVGDYFHNYPSRDIDFYFQNETRLDGCKALTDAFEMLVHAGFGNHDYDRHVPREMSHELFRRKFGLKPYYTVEHRGWKFIHLNNFLGNTWTDGHAEFDPKTGSLGEQQLNWFEAELAQRKPSFVFIHYPLSNRERDRSEGLRRVRADQEASRRYSAGGLRALAQMVRIRSLVWTAAPGDGCHALQSERVSDCGSGCETGPA
jgi:hypothetical protein